MDFLFSREINLVPKKNHAMSLNLLLYNFNLSAVNLIYIEIYRIGKRSVPHKEETIRSAKIFLKNNTK